MLDAQAVGRVLVAVAFVLFVAGGFLVLYGRLFPNGLPGDIRVQSEGFTCLAPVTTMILLSIVLTLFVNLILRLIDK